MRWIAGFLGGGAAGSFPGLGGGGGGGGGGYGGGALGGGGGGNDDTPSSGGLSLLKELTNLLDLCFATSTAFTDFLEAWRSPAAELPQLCVRSCQAALLSLACYCLHAAFAASEACMHGGLKKV